MTHKSRIRKIAASLLLFDVRLEIWNENRKVEFEESERGKKQHLIRRGQQIAKSKLRYFR